MTLQRNSLLMVQSKLAISNTHVKQKLVHYNVGFVTLEHLLRQIKSKGNVIHFDTAGFVISPGRYSRV